MSGSNHLTTSISFIVLLFCLLPHIQCADVHRIVAKGSFPHDNKAFVEGFCIDNSNADKFIAFESTGIWAKSSIRTYKDDFSNVDFVSQLPKDIFAEGCTVVGDKVYQLTYTARKILSYNKADLITPAPGKPLSYGFVPLLQPIQDGWGITSDEHDNVYISDGSSSIYQLDSSLSAIRRTIKVGLNTAGSRRSISQLNEIEWVDGQLWANYYQTNCILRIDPTSGDILGVLRGDGLYTGQHGTVEVMNGIAYDRNHKRLYVTGKNWDKIYEIEYPPATIYDASLNTNNLDLATICPFNTVTTADAQYWQQISASSLLQTMESTQQLSSPMVQSIVQTAVGNHQLISPSPSSSSLSSLSSSSLSSIVPPTPTSKLRRLFRPEYN